MNLDLYLDGIVGIRFESRPKFRSFGDPNLDLVGVDLNYPTPPAVNIYKDPNLIVPCCTLRKLIYLQHPVRSMHQNNMHSCKFDSD